MEIHKPKPFHSWGELLYEILIIVIGVLIALGLEQFADALRWRYKVAQAEQNMRIEVARDRTNAAQYAILTSCADAYLDRMQSDLLRHDTADLARLYELGEPFISEAWTATAWDAAVASQIGDHMDTNRFLNYAEAFRRSMLMRDVQFRLRDHFVAAKVARFDLPDSKSQGDALTSAEYLRRDIALARDITRDFIANTDALNIVPDAAKVGEYQRKAAVCVDALRSKH